MVFLVTIGVQFRRLLFSPKVFGYLEETRSSCGLLSFTDRVTGNNWNKLLTFSFGILHGILSDSIPQLSPGFIVESPLTDSVST